MRVRRAALLTLFVLPLAACEGVLEVPRVRVLVDDSGAPDAFRGVARPPEAGAAPADAGPATPRPRLDAAPPPGPPLDAGRPPVDARPPPPRIDAAPPPPPPPVDAAPPVQPPDPGVPAHCADGPLAGPLPNCRPAPPPTTGDPAADCVARINQFRMECQCLPPLQRWVEGEACADQHAEYDSTRGAHAGFRAHICPQGGFGQNECPGYNGFDHVIGVCLQQMWDEGPGENFQAHGHYLNMTNPRFSRVACGFYEGGRGNMWAVQNFQ